MIFMEFNKGVSQGHQGWKKAVAGGTMASVYPATEIRKGQESGGKGMYQVGQGWEQRLYKDGRGKDLDALLLDA